MQRHINDKHNSNPQVYKCAYCSYESKHKKNYKQHMERKHRREYERVEGSAKAIRTPGQTPQTPARAAQDLLSQINGAVALNAKSDPAQPWSAYTTHLQQALRQGRDTLAEAVSNEPPSASPLPANDDDGPAAELEAVFEGADDESDLIRSEKE